MKDFDALKDIWTGQVSEPGISFETLSKQVRKQSGSFSRKLMLEIISMTLALALLIGIWIYSPITLWSTHLALLILVCCCVYYLFNQIADLRSLRHHPYITQRSSEYIAYLKQYQRRRYIFNTRKYGIYSVFIGLAFALYFLELAFIAPLWQVLMGLSFTIAWFFICWQLMRLYVRREQERLNSIVRKLERIQQQFEQQEQ